MLNVGGKSTPETYYDILSVKEDASYDEIRASYKIAALSSHPDKLNLNKEQAPHESAAHERFLMVQKAWEVLSNSRFRALYDRQLSASKQDLLLASEVRLEEMSVQNSDDVLELSYPCRCGDLFTINSAELAEMGYSLGRAGELKIEGAELEPASIIIPCYSCSTKIHLIIDVTF